MIATTAVICDGVVIEGEIDVGDFSILGAAFSGQTDETTRIGPGAKIRSHVVIYAGNRIGANFHAGNKANIRELNVIGDDVSVGALSVVEHHVTLEDGVRIHSQAFIPEFTRVEKNAWIGPQVVITNSRYPRSRNSKQDLQGVVIRENAKIGANVTILPGVVIGKNCLVGAGSVVTKSLPDNGIYVGNPAVLIREAFY